MTKRFLITTGVLSLMLTGCNSMLYSDTMAPVYSTNGTPNRTQPPMIKQPQATQAAIERPSNTTVINNSQQNPYATTTPAGANNAQAVATSAVNQNGVVNPNAVQNISNAATNAPVQNIARPNAVTQAKVNVNNSVANANTQATNAVKNTAQNAVNQKTQQAANQANAAANNVKQSAQASVNNAANQATAKVANAVPPKPATGKSATKLLLQEARSSVAAGQYEKAASALERAHRIEPSNSKILYDIAQIRYAQGKYRQAASFASKAANYSKSAGLSKKIWTILGNSRKALGNNTGASAALQKAATF